MTINLLQTVSAIKILTTKSKICIVTQMLIVLNLFHVKIQIIICDMTFIDVQDIYWRLC